MYLHHSPFSCFLLPPFMPPLPILLYPGKEQEMTIIHHFRAKYGFWEFHHL
jgi:hypothetical protein